MRRPNFLALSLAALALAGVGCNDDDPGSEDFSSVLSGANEIPARPTTASGSAGFSYDGQRVNFVIQVNGIANVTQAHIHSGDASVNGPVRVFLFPAPPANAAVSTPVSFTGTGVLTSGSFEPSHVTGVTFDQLLAEMRAGTAYVNVHTTQFPGGEIRGQVRLVQR